MITLERFTAVGIALALLVGCSAKTKEEAKEALDATTEAASSAAKDTKANVKKAAEVIDAGVDRAREKANEIESPAGDSPEDADATPEAEER